MTIRRPSAFMPVSSSPDRGLRSVPLVMGVDLREFTLPEMTRRQRGMGNRETRLVHLALTETDDIEIERPRGPAIGGRTHASCRALDGLAAREQLARQRHVVGQHQRRGVPGGHHGDAGHLGQVAGPDSTLQLQPAAATAKACEKEGINPADDASAERVGRNFLTQGASVGDRVGIRPSRRSEGGLHLFPAEPA